MNIEQLRQSCETLIEKNGPKAVLDIVLSNTVESKAKLMGGRIVLRGKSSSQYEFKCQVLLNFINGKIPTKGRTNV